MAGQGTLCAHLSSSLMAVGESAVSSKRENRELERGHPEGHGRGQAQSVLWPEETGMSLCYLIISVMGKDARQPGEGGEQGMARLFLHSSVPGEDTEVW